MHVLHERPLAPVPAKLGVTFPTINRWENGRARPSPLAMQKIEELFRSMG
ncbi:MAG: helix-turn-helix transcriptional regulator, partial [Pseudomonadota bacterium]